MPSVISTTSPPGRRVSSGSAKWLVTRWVSTARRSRRRPASRSCSHSGVSHSNSFSPPQMSLTSTSSRPWSESMRWTSASHLARLEVVDGHRDAGAAGGVHQLGGLLDRLGPVVLRAPLARAAPGAVHGRAGLAEGHRDAAAGAARGAGHQGHPALKRAGSYATPGHLQRSGLQRPLRRPPGPGRRRPPAPAVSDSPNTAAASATVTTGSSVDRMAAAVGPTRRRPAKNSAIAPTVDTTASATSHSQPEAGHRGGVQAAGDQPGAVSVIAAPVHTSVVSASASDARGDALRGQDVDGVDAGRAQRPGRWPRAPASRPPRRPAPAAMPPQARTSATRRAGAGLVALQDDRGHGHHDREGVEHQRQQRRVHAVERGEVAAGLGAVAHRAEPQRQQPRRGGRSPAAGRGRPMATRARATGPAPPRRSGRTAASPPSSPPRRPACRTPPSRRRRRRRSGRGWTPVDGHGGHAGHRLFSIDSAF